MPAALSPLAQAGIQAGMQALAIGGQAAATAGANKKSRKFALDMYNLQREHALYDYQIQNEYNSPKAQMARLRDAGLNPNLVYGDGATTTAAAIRSSSPQSWNPRTPNLDFGSVASGGLGAYYDARIKEAQADNLQAQASVLQQDKWLKAAQTIATLNQGDNSAFDLDLKRQIREYSIDAAKYDVESKQRNIQVLLNRDEREAAQNASNLQEAAQRIMRMKQQTINDQLSNAKTEQETRNLKEQLKQIRAVTYEIQQSGRIKNLDADLKSQGIQPHDNIFMRTLGEIINNITRRYGIE